MFVEVKVTAIRVGSFIFRMRGLYDLNQHPEAGVPHPHADGETLQIEAGVHTHVHVPAAAPPISSALWPLFGVVWPSGRLLAEHVDGRDLHGARVLELGSGLALPSLVAHRHRADVTVSDHHPLAASFLAHNLVLNQLGPLPYRHLDWRAANPREGRYDVIMASDVLYEPAHGAELSRFLVAHLHASATVLITDPGRRHYKGLGRALVREGFALVETRHLLVGDEAKRPMGRLLVFARG